MKQSKTVALQNLLYSNELEFLMEAHNGISAKIAEKAGFKGIWASSLTISASMGVRDNNELSSSQILDILEYMADCTEIPILLDGDTGYGNFNKVRRLVKYLEKICVAGLCMEDKIFPKQNSFQESGSQELIHIEEFCGKIKAAKDTQVDPNFVVVARVESFVAGKDVEEALKRAEAYREAGADAIVVHSKKSTAEEIESFMKGWTHDFPIIIIPTKYYATPTQKFRDLKVQMVIWANHSLRSAIRAMERVTQKIYNEKSLLSIENEVATIKDIFEYQNLIELEEAEKKYMPSIGSPY